MRIVIVAGESSGDQLGAGLIEAILRSRPDVEIEGIAGPLMKAAGCRELFPADRLAVMGLFEVLARLPELLGIRRALLHRLQASPPDLYIGIDAPDFNFPVERRLKARGVKVVHYVSPSVWAWRESRWRGIKRAVDHMLTLLPFEQDFYQRHGIPVTFVGHPLVDELPLAPDRIEARRKLNLPAQGVQIALLPGSRGGEYRRLAPIFLRTAQLLAETGFAGQFLIPVIDEQAGRWIAERLKKFPVSLPVVLIDRRSRLVMEAADVVLLASGTAALEAMLLNRPMVVAYRFATLTYWVLKVMVKIRLFALPNLLAGEQLVPELIQNQATAEACARELRVWLDNPALVVRLQDRFRELRKQLGGAVSLRAAGVVLGLVRGSLDLASGGERWQ